MPRKSFIVPFVLLLVLCLLKNVAMAESGNISQGKADKDASLQLYPRLSKDIEKKRLELAKLERDMELKQQQLDLLKDEVSRVVSKLEKKRKEIEDKCYEIRMSKKDRLARIVSIYSTMPAEESALRIVKLDIKSVVMILHEMKPKKAANILSFIEPAKAAEISENLLK